MSGAPEPQPAFFAVNALPSCPHAQEAKRRGLLKFSTEVVPSICSCNSNEEWICLFCSHVGCSLYINGHAKAHYENALDSKSCCLAYGKLDGSVWCYLCDNYIDFFLEESLKEVYSEIYAFIHGELPHLPKSRLSGDNNEKK